MKGSPKVVERLGAALAVVLLLVIMAGLPRELVAGTLPDISGTWYAQGDHSKRCSINQSGNSVSLTNEQGRSANGYFVNPSVISSDWGYFGARDLRGTISNDLRRIDWSNGTYWIRGSGAPRPVATPNPYRTLDFATASLTPAAGPIAVIDGWGAVKRDGKGVIVCVSFKNEHPVAATRILFDFLLTNRKGDTLETLNLDRRGTFSPNVEIRGWRSLSDWQGGVGHRGYGDNCVSRESGIAAMSLSRAYFVSYRIERVDFVDGTVWPQP